MFDAYDLNVIVAMIIISSFRQSSFICKLVKLFLFSSHKNEIGVLLYFI